jgi:hypothetical protein
MLFKELVKGDIFVLGLSDEEYDGRVYMKISGSSEYLVDTVELNPSVCIYCKDRDYIGELNMVSDTVPIRKLVGNDINKYLSLEEV